MKYITIFLSFLLIIICLGQSQCGYPQVKVTIKTADESFSGTNDDVYIYFGTGSPRPLENRLNNDFESGNTDEFILTVDFGLCDISKITIVKYPDPLVSTGGWIMEGLKVEYMDPNGTVTTVYENPSINAELNGLRTYWTAEDFVSPCE